jgi:hypothetical protein
MSRKLVILCGALCLVLVWQLVSRSDRPEERESQFVVLEAYAADEQGNVARGPNERFYIVGDRLDEGGSLYLYVDLKDVVRKWMDEVGTLLKEGGGPAEAAMGYAVGDAVIEVLGLYDVEDLGMSTVKGEDTNRTKAFIRVPGEKRGIFKVLGGEPHPFQLLSYAPPETALYRSVEIDPEELLGLVRKVFETVGGAPQAAMFDHMMVQAGEKLGTDVRTVAASLTGEMVLLAEFDEMERIELPMPGPEPMTAAAPRFALLAETTDPTLFEAVKTLLTPEGGTLEEETVDGDVRLVRIPVPPNDAFPMDPVVAYDGRCVIFTSHRMYLGDIMRAAGGGENLSAQPEFQEITAGLPEAGNGLMFVSRRFPEWVQSVFQEAAAGLGSEIPGGGGLLQGIMGEPASTAMVRANQPDGVWIVANGTMSGADVLMFTMAAPLGALPMAIAIPNFLEAKSRSKVARAKSEMRNLAVNLETYYIDHNTYPPAVDEEGGIVPFGGNGSKVSAGYTPWLLTTPIAYTAVLPSDPFHEGENGEYMLYRYATNGAYCWILTSQGPDSDMDVEIAEYPKPNQTQCNPREFFSQYGVGSAIEYDATNGTKSSGDIFRVGP